MFEACRPAAWGATLSACVPRTLRLCPRRHLGPMDCSDRKPSTLARRRRVSLPRNGFVWWLLEERAATATLSDRFLEVGPSPQTLCGVDAKEALGEAWREFLLAAAGVGSCANPGRGLFYDVARGGPAPRRLGASLRRAAERQCVMVHLGPLCDRGGSRSCCWQRRRRALTGRAGMRRGSLLRPLTSSLGCRPALQGGARHE